MKIQFLGQGYEPISELSVGNLLLTFLVDKDFYTFTGITAFTSQSAVKGFEDKIKAAKEHLKNITIVTGIDQKVTSKEALEALIDLDIEAYVFYHRSSTIFHPKIYLFEGDNKTELIIGSSNFTSSGLFLNIESSLRVTIDNSIEADRKIIEDLKAYFYGIFDRTDPNLEILTHTLIDQLVEENIVLTEIERKAILAKEKLTERKESVKSGTFPKRDIPRIPKEFREKLKSGNKSEDTKSPVQYSVSTEKSELVWQSGPLTERDLNIPTGSTTNATGSMLFKKGKTKDIDQRHYFRDTVFSSLEWIKDLKPSSSHFERAEALFKIIVNGSDCGNFKLLLSHNTRTDSRSYQQNNSMTSISWGKAKNVIGKSELIGKTANLYKNDDDEFTLEIV